MSHWNFKISVAIVFLKLLPRWTGDAYHRLRVVNRILVELIRPRMTTTHCKQEIMAKRMYDFIIIMKNVETRIRQVNIKKQFATQYNSKIVLKFK